MKLLIDADILAMRAAFACEKSRYLVQNEHGRYEYDDAKSAKESAFSNDTHVWSRKVLEPEEKSIMIVDTMIKDLHARYNDTITGSHLFLSGVGNYRHNFATRASYKGNRSGAAPPTHLKAIRLHLQMKHGAVVSHGEEADDLIGIAMTDFPDSVCCSVDKDLRQLAGRHYDFVKKEESVVSQKEAVLNFYRQVISGDSVDAVPGATGYGPVKAAKALEGCKSPWDCWQVALGIYVKEFGTISGPLFAVEAASLVHVRRSVGQIWEAPVAPIKSKVAA